jgi:hypothetical protein
LMMRLRFALHIMHSTHQKMADPRIRRFDSNQGMRFWMLLFGGAKEVHLGN